MLKNLLKIMKNNLKEWYIRGHFRNFTQNIQVKKELHQLDIKGKIHGLYEEEDDVDRIENVINFFL